MSTILRMDQLQHFREGEDFRDVSNAILFDADMLVNLRRRAEQLADETNATRRWHRINFVHMKRMMRDVKFMRFEITRLEEEIKDAQMKRFGLIINLDDLEEEVLRRYIFELETSAEEEMRLLEQELQERRVFDAQIYPFHSNDLLLIPSCVLFQLELSRCDELLVQETQNNTEKLNIERVLREQKNMMDVLLDVQNSKYDKWAHPQVLNLMKLSYDIEKLIGTDNALRDQIEVCGSLSLTK